MSIEVAPQNLAPVFLDTVYLRELHVSAVVVPDAWGRPGKTQPVTINIELQMNTLATGNSDDLQNSFSYGQMSKDIISTVDGKEFASVNNLMTGVVDAARMWPGQYIHCRIRLPKAFLRVDTGFSSHFSLNKQPTGSWALNSQKWAIEGIKAACIIGLNAHERLEKQAVSIHLLVALDTSDPEEMTKPIVIERWQALVKEVLKVVEDSEFQTLEVLALLIAQTCLASNLMPGLTVTVEKPSALGMVEGSGVTISRSRPHLNGVLDS